MKVYKSINAYLEIGNKLSIPTSRVQGRIQDFKLKLHRAEGGANIFGAFRVKNHDFTPKNHIFSNGEGRRVNYWGISCEKSRFYANKSYFFQF